MNEPHFTAEELSLIAYACRELGNKRLEQSFHARRCSSISMDIAVANEVEANKLFAIANKAQSITSPAG